MKRKRDMPSKRDAMQALEAMCMALAVWRASEGSVVEERCAKEVRALADRIYRTMTPQGHLVIQMGIEKLLQEHTSDREDAGGAGGDPVVDVPLAAHEERNLRSVPLQEQEVDLPPAGGGAVADGAEAEVAPGPGPDLE